MSTHDEVAEAAAWASTRYHDHHHREQARAYPVLGGLLERARTEGLPAVTWKVTWTGVVWATTDCAFNDVDRRADWNAWVDALGARSTAREDRLAAGATHLHAATLDYRGSGVTVGVQVDLDGPKDDGLDHCQDTGRQA